MRIADRLQQNLTIALDTLRAGKIRSALTILGVVIGVATDMAMAAIVSGILEQIVHTIESRRVPWIGGVTEPDD